MPQEEKQNSADDIIIEEETEALRQEKTDKIKKMKEALEECRKERQEYLDGWQRMKADGINLRREEEKRRGELTAIIREGFVEDLVPVLDSFRLAFANKETWEKVDENWRKGVEYIHSQLFRILEEKGLREFGTSGDTFDVALHVSEKTISTEEKEKDGRIADVIEKGYRTGNTIIRPARVSVFEYKETETSN